MAVKTNPDLPISYQRPGVYVFQSLQGAPPVVDNRRVNILAYKTSAGSGSVDVITRVFNEDEVVQLAGKGSDAVQIFQHIQSMARGGGEYNLLLVNAPSGTAQTRTLKIMARPSGAALGINTTASKACVINVFIEGWVASVQVAAGDDFPTIAANLNAEILKIQDFLSCTTGVASDTVTLTGRHAAETSKDIPIMVSVSDPTAGVAVSFGTLTLATAADATTTNTHTLLVTASTATYNPSNGESANSAAANFITAINAATGFPATAAQTAASAVITLFFVDNVSQPLVVNRPVASTTDADQTVTLAAGTAGSGSPTLTNALNAIKAQPTLRLWVTNFTDDASFAVLGTLANHLIAEGGGQKCKGQELVFASTLRLTTAGGFPAGSTPALTTSPRFFMAWNVANPQRALASAARYVAAILNRLDYPPFNYAGYPLTTDGRMPWLATPQAQRPTDVDINAAMVTYYMTPITVTAQNQIVIESGRTTAKPSATLDGDYRWIGVQLADDYVRDDLILSLPGVIQGKSLKAYGTPRTQYTTTPAAIRDAAAERVLFYESQDIFDGGELLMDKLRAERNATYPARVDVELPKRFPVPAEQISVVTTKAA